MRLSLGTLKSSNENMTVVFLLSVLPSFCIKEIRVIIYPHFKENYKKNFPIWAFFQFL